MAQIKVHGPAVGILHPAHQHYRLASQLAAQMQPLFEQRSAQPLGLSAFGDHRG